MKEQIVDAVNQCRRELLIAGRARHDVRSIEVCLKKRLLPFSHDPHVKALLDTVASGHLNSTSLLELTHSVDPTFILGFFDVPYNPESYLEAASLSFVPIPRSVLSRYPTSHAAPVLVQSSTDGFKEPLAVAVFGENYVGAELKEHHRAYYFVDKFARRFIDHTRAAVSNSWSPTAFSPLMDADYDTLIQASAIWVHLHEFHHRKGFLPLPKYLNDKSSRNAAGAEELRVDIWSILSLMSLVPAEPITHIAIQYILAERLIRYPLQAEPQENYDARSSIALFNFLFRHDVIGSRRGRFYFEGGFARLRRALQSIAVKMHAIEYSISLTQEIDRKKELSKILPALAMNEDNWRAERAF